MAPGHFSLYAAVCATAGTAMASAAANSINQILEVPFDSQMNRTKNRQVLRDDVSHLSRFYTLLNRVHDTNLWLLLWQPGVITTQTTHLRSILNHAGIILYFNHWCGSEAVEPDSYNKSRIWIQDIYRYGKCADTYLLGLLVVSSSVARWTSVENLLMLVSLVLGYLVPV